MDKTVESGVREAAQALLDDVRRRYPGEELRCQYMRELDTALSRTDSPASEDAIHNAAVRECIEKADAVTPPPCDGSEAAQAAGYGAQEMIVDELRTLLRPEKETI